MKEIFHLTFYDENLVKYLNKLENDSIRSTEAERLLLIGLSVSKHMQSSKDMEFVKNKIQGMITDVDKILGKMSNDIGEVITEHISKNFDPNIDTSFLAKTALYMREAIKIFKEDVAKEMANSKEVIQVMLENAEKTSEAKTEDVTKTIDDLGKSVKEADEYIQSQLDNTNTGSFVFLLNKEIEKYFSHDSTIIQLIGKIIGEFTETMRTEMNSLRELVAEQKGRADMIDKTAIKGFTFEEDVFNTLSMVASPYSDVCVHVGAESTGVSKKGDIVYELESGERIVIECKDEAIGLKPMLKYLDAAMENRGCEFAVLVVKKNEQLQQQIGLMNIYQGNKLFCTAETLPYVMRFVRIVLAMSKADIAEGVNAAVIKDNLEIVRNEMKSFQTIKTKLTTMKNTVVGNTETIAETLVGMERNMNQVLSNIERELESDDDKE